MAAMNEKVSIYVPEDIVFSILSKLPLKSVKRFTCVNKLYTLLFENPYFVNMFYKNMVSKYNSLYDEPCFLLNHESSNLESKLYLISGKRIENKVPLNWPHPFNQNPGYNYYQPFIASSSVNGTLCIYDENDYHPTIVLWNPATDELHIVPKDHDYYVISDFSDDRDITYTVHGFGYDNVSDDYKIIRYVDYHGKLDTLWQGPYWEIYSLESNFWETLYVDMRHRFWSSVGAGVHLDGVCHWWSKEDCETYVVSFNLSTEVPVTTLLPSELHDLDQQHVNRDLAVLNGHVIMISRYVKTTSFHISISMLGEPGVNESWIKLFDVGPLSDIKGFIGAGRKADIFLKKADDELAYFDLNTGVIQNIGVKVNSSCSQVVFYKKKIPPIGGIQN
ncbi:putative F-box domain-containing protein [Medicago truncatula]|uniref:F-box protein interaction domain protein n=1 Tax=Medicago truncatula TaxID=3880 RepID=G7IQW7_MEDTR|nr:F-box/kelch-repeat protein At3g06240 [Medicago truncatula]AES66326.1 F-box protein interaction domain protein [Medicago truncatula]RHN74451.1 putative F-box domain-containing protein [Medicago truncatula]